MIVDEANVLAVLNEDLFAGFSVQLALNIWDLFTSDCGSMKLWYGYGCLLILAAG